MFYCDDCAEKRNYPETIFKSRGTCEICGKNSVCNERPSILLPSSKEKIDDTGVHVTHCCYEHGCKYGELDCPVATMTVKQAADCEDCVEERKRANDMWFDVNKSLPNSNTRVLITYTAEYMLTPQVIQGFYARHYSQLGLVWQDDSGDKLENVIAWQPMPKPYVKEV